MFINQFLSLTLIFILLINGSTSAYGSTQTNYSKAYSLTLSSMFDKNPTKKNILEKFMKGSIRVLQLYGQITDIEINTTSKQLEIIYILKSGKIITHVYASDQNIYRENEVSAVKEKAELYKIIGNEAYKKNNYKTALEYYFKTIDLIPNYAAVYFNIGQSFAKLKNIKLAKANYEKAVQHKKDYWKAHYALLNTLFLSGDYSAAKKAAATYKSVAADHQSQEIITLIDKIDKMYTFISTIRTSDPSRAIEILTEALNLNPQDPQLFTNRALLYAQLNMQQEMFEDLRHALLLDPHSEVARKTFMENIVNYYIKLPHESLEYSKMLDLAFIIEPNHKKPELYFVRSTIYDRNGDFDNALLDIQTAEKIGIPTSLKKATLTNKKAYLLKIINKKKAQKKYDDAIEKINELLKITTETSERSEQILLRGDVYLDAKKYTAALTDYATILEKNKSSLMDKAKEKMLTVLKKANTIELFTKYENLLCDKYSFYILKASAYFKIKDSISALKELDKAKKIALKNHNNKQFIQAIEIRILIYRNLNQTIKLKIMLSKLLEIFKKEKYAPDEYSYKAIILENLVDIAITNNELSKAFDLNDKILKEFPDFMPAYVAKGTFLIQLNKLEEAIDYFNQAEKILEMEKSQKSKNIWFKNASEKQIVPLYANRGNSYYKLNKPKEALADYEKALKKTKDIKTRQELHKNIAAAKERLILLDTLSMLPQNAKTSEYIQAHMLLSQAIKIYDEYIADYPTDDYFKKRQSELYYNSFLINKKNSNLNAAFNDLVKAEKLNKNDPDIYEGMAWVFSLLNNFDEAIACMDKAITLKPGEFNFYYNRMILLANQGFIEKALQDADMLIQIEPSNSAGYYYKSTLLLQYKPNKLTDFVNQYPQFFTIKKEEPPKIEIPIVELSHKKPSLVGTVYWAPTLPSDPKQERPVVVLEESEEGLLVAPCTTQKLERLKWSEIPLHLKKNCKLLLDKPRIISPDFLLDQITELDEESMENINEVFSQVKETKPVKQKLLHDYAIQRLKNPLYIINKSGLLELQKDINCVEPLSQSQLQIIKNYLTAQKEKLKLVRTFSEGNTLYHEYRSTDGVFVLMKYDKKNSNELIDIQIFETPIQVYEIVERVLKNNNPLVTAILISKKQIKDTMTYLRKIILPIYDTTKSTEMLMDTLNIHNIPDFEHYLKMMRTLKTAA